MSHRTTIRTNVKCDNKQLVKDALDIMGIAHSEEDTNVSCYATVGNLAIRMEHWKKSPGIKLQSIGLSLDSQAKEFRLDGDFYLLRNAEGAAWNENDIKDQFTQAYRAAVAVQAAKDANPTWTLDHAWTGTQGQLIVECAQGY